ncbi:MAG: hypothetical protein BWY72_01414 [Bacteroidetes bacterium ADurb.Bin416]|nr:MAG: hypothetical protein BWY72_01414 [Bacteroidetes bacterium ADurb.Bin416]
MVAFNVAKSTMAVSASANKDFNSVIELRMLADNVTVSALANAFTIKVSRPSGRVSGLRAST